MTLDTDCKHTEILSHRFQTRGEVAAMRTLVRSDARRDKETSTGFEVLAGFGGIGTLATDIEKEPASVLSTSSDAMVKLPGRG